ncbi:MAG: hypothetical protein WCN98_08140 [Verrucomicrobiaceae bacterium]
MKKSRTIIHFISVLLLLLWGGVMLYFYASGRLARGEYVSKEGWFSAMVLVGGIGCLIVGLFNLVTIGATEGDCCDHDHDHDHDHSGHHHHEHDHSCCGHDHEHHEHSEVQAVEGHSHGILEESGAFGRFVAIFILAVPVTYAAIKSPDQFSKIAIENKGVYDANYGETSGDNKFTMKKESKATIASTSVPTPEPTASPDTASQPKSVAPFTLADLKAQVPQSKEGNFMLDVPEIFYTAGDKEVQAVLEGQKVETIAQVLPEKVNNPNGTRLRIFRLLIQCCAADARPLSIPVEFGKTPPNFKDMAWVKVVGKLSFKSENNQTVPVLEATSMVETVEPDSKAIY